MLHSTKFSVGVRLFEFFLPNQGHSLRQHSMLGAGWVRLRFFFSHHRSAESRRARTRVRACMRGLCQRLRFICVIGGEALYRWIFT